MRVLLALILLAIHASSQEPALVRSELMQDSAWAGERVELRIELLVPGRFSGTPSFDLPELEGAVILKSGANSGRPVLGTRRVEGADYVTALHRFAVFFQRDGRFTLEPFAVRFGSIAAFGEDPVEHRLPTQPMEIEVRMPAGAEGLSMILATSRLEASQTWSPEPGDAKAGDAFQRTVTLTAPDLPGLLLPALPLEQVEGVDVYRGDPSVETDMQRGEFRGKRVEQVTYVCTEGGQVEIPELVLTWWNVQTKAIEQTVLEGASFQVAAAPVEPAASAAEDPGIPALLPWLAGIAGVAVLAAGLLMLRLRKSRDSGASAPNEASRFAELVQCLKREDAAASLRALYGWLDLAWNRRELSTLEELRRESPELSIQLDHLERSALAGQAWSGSELLGLLRQVRAHGNEHARTAASLLPPLNPRS